MTATCSAWLIRSPICPPGTSGCTAGTWPPTSSFSPVAGVMSDHYGRRRPTFIAVEPETAACLLESNLRLRPAKIPGDLITEMAMLSTGSASAAAWPILERRIDGFLAIGDAVALSAHARLTDATCGDPPLDVGISGAAGVAGLMQICACPRLSRLIGLSQDSRVAVIGTEWGR